MASWQVQEAKTKLSEVIDRAISEGPQTITRHGKARAVVVSIDEYEALAKKRRNFVDFLIDGPRFDIDIERSKDLPRDIDLE
ncbi:type II toxin-antitoxin system Phd/YefM family antitoxin [Kaistia defluvii]|uniref:type II toxin-antitoxin system Phd/YefM family antitoxin n=1 Tax=Kaistia defluvii TaxID=410841 RepID=UPI00224F0C33|nr:type II toxin-antitoxin system Phd/YefM family antitoxin [Kaistia defluvii]MCX5516988.1 type II toxin-antitoxin system Phd/YefM family antitoxin [Kaistia defluvii]